MQVVIHAGAISTDEGRILKSLLANKGALVQQGVTVPGPGKFKPLFKEALDSMESKPPSPSTREILEDAILDGEDASRVVLSNEHFFGAQWSAIRDDQFYPLAGPRMAYLDELFLGAQVELFMGLRNPASFIPKVLMSLSPKHREDVMNLTDISYLSWLTMVEDIVDLAPNVRMTLWCNEDTPLIWGDIIRAMSGLAPDAPLRNEFTFLSSLLSETGKRALKELIAQQSASNTAIQSDQLAEIFRAFAEPEKIQEELDFPGWSEDVVEAFTTIYHQDLAEIQTIPGIRFLTP
ncbi:MAG: hypothetical protein ACR2O2_13755 [Ruegeria sp.]